MKGLLMRIHHACVRLAVGAGMYDDTRARERDLARESDDLVTAAAEQALESRTLRAEVDVLCGAAPRWGVPLVRPSHADVLDAAEKGESLPDPPGYRGAGLDPWQVQEQARLLVAEYGYTVKLPELAPQE